MSIYRGFNTIDRDFGPYKLRDQALIIRDLLNHFSIRKGEKLHNPNFGSIIWNTLFEPLTPAIKEDIRKDVERIVNYDPRIRSLNRVVVTEYESGLRLDVEITFASTDQRANLQLEFDRDTRQLSTTL